ncbi:MAG: homeostatic response regulator transcription factor HsrA [Helicobacter sp.]|nr:homeostatic response regulator transcription factor HsrA [Helicobacter sp.]
MRILLFDKEQNTQAAFKNYFSKHNYQLDAAQNIKDAQYFADIRNYNLVLLCGSGSEVYDLLNSIKAKDNKTIVIIIDAPNAPLASEIKAFGNNADDYLRKAQHIDEDYLSALLGRIKIRLKHSASGKIEISDLAISPDDERVIYKGSEIDVKGKPFEVLAHLARHRDQIISKEQLLDAIWEEPELVTPNVIEVAINQIRQKLDKVHGISTVETVRRRGYRFCYKD